MFSPRILSIPQSPAKGSFIHMNITTYSNPPFLSFTYHSALLDLKPFKTQNSAFVQMYTPHGTNCYTLHVTGMQ